MQTIIKLKLRNQDWNESGSTRIVKQTDHNQSRLVKQMDHNQFENRKVNANHNQVEIKKSRSIWIWINLNSRRNGPQSKIEKSNKRTRVKNERTLIKVPSRIKETMIKPKSGNQDQQQSESSQLVKQMDHNQVALRWQICGAKTPQPQTQPARRWPAEWSLDDPHGRRIRMEQTYHSSIFHLLFTKHRIWVLIKAIYWS